MSRDRGRGRSKWGRQTIMYRPPDVFSNRWRIRSRWNKCVVLSRMS